jgi:hypothetical protein
MSTDYTRHAHRRTVLAELQRVLLQRFISKGGDEPKERLLCEEVFFADKEVTQEALMEIMEELQRREADERIQMTQYEFRRRDVTTKPAKASKEGPGEDGTADQPPAAKPAGKPAGPNPGPGG